MLPVFRPTGLTDYGPITKFRRGHFSATSHAGEIVVFDKAYADFAHLRHLHQEGVIRVSWAKENVCFEVMGQQLSEEEMQQAQHLYKAGIFMGRQPIVLSDCRIKLTRDDTYAKYPDEIRMIDACVLQDGKPCLVNCTLRCLAWRMEKIVSKVLHPRKGRARELRRPFACPPSRCSSTSATSERQNENLTKPLFQNGLCSRSEKPSSPLF